MKGPYLACRQKQSRSLLAIVANLWHGDVVVNVFEGDGEADEGKYHALLGAALDSLRLQIRLCRKSLVPGAIQGLAILAMLQQLLGGSPSCMGTSQQ